MLDIWKWLLGLLGLAAKTLTGEAAEFISGPAKKVVAMLEENPDLTGSEKYDRARAYLKDHYGGDIADKFGEHLVNRAINLAIEAAVAVIKEKL